MFKLAKIWLVNTKSTYVDMPDAFADIIRTRSGSGFSSSFTGELDPRILLKAPNTFRKQPRSDEIKEAG